MLLLAAVASVALSVTAAITSTAKMVAHPPSTLLQPGTTSLPLKLTTSQAGACRWGDTDASYGAMTHDFVGTGVAHSATIMGLSGDLGVTVITVRCLAFPADKLTLVYRSLPDVKVAPFPRLGNLWGNGNFRGHPEGLKYAASRSSLWLGSDWNASEIAQLRANNPFSVVLTSINACETTRTDLPDDFYLTNVTRPASTKGRLQSWPGAFRLDLTNPAVQQMQAQLMYDLVIYGGHEGIPPSTSSTPPMPFDGIFVDNVFMDDGQWVDNQDIFHNKFYPSTVTPGKADDLNVFAERWRSGMVAELNMFRELMPYALMDGHISVDAMRKDINISGTFNAVSIGFTTVEVIEGRRTFSEGFKEYTDWMSIPTREPHITMVESAVRLQLGYGYGFGKNLSIQITTQCENSNSLPGAAPPANGAACTHSKQTPQQQGFFKPQAYMFARSEYRYMRFGLGYTLMNDGFFTHELGDSWHGMDWDYDELHFNLGLAMGNATTVMGATSKPPPPPVPVNSDWTLYCQKTAGGNASLHIDASQKPNADSPPSVRIDVHRASSSPSGIELHSDKLAFHAGAFTLFFTAKASVAKNTQLHAATMLDDPPWSSFGLGADFELTTQWAKYSATFTAPRNSSDVKLSFLMGNAASGASVWINSPTIVGTAIKPSVMMREFECGVAVLNGESVAQTIDLTGKGLERLVGKQAPKWQYTVDDNSSAFATGSGSWVSENFNSGYIMTDASQEQVRPAAGYAHHWELGAHRSPTTGGAATATFDLQVPEKGLYKLSLWWPDSTTSIRSGWAGALSAAVIAPSPSDEGVAKAAVKLDLRDSGGDMWMDVTGSAMGAELEPGSKLVVSCPQAGGDCVVDAVLVESVARWNDGSAVSKVTLQAFDAIVLRRATASHLPAPQPLPCSVV